MIKSHLCKRKMLGLDFLSFSLVMIRDMGMTMPCCPYRRGQHPPWWWNHQTHGTWVLEGLMDENCPCCCVREKKILISAIMSVCLFVTENFTLMFPSENREVEPQEVLCKASILRLPNQALFLSWALFIPTHFYCFFFFFFLLFL